MQMIIEARLIDDVGETAPVRLAVIERESTTSPLGLSLAEGKELLASAQKYFVAEQSLSIAGAHSYCSRCGVRFGVKGWHQRQIRNKSTIALQRVRREATRGVCQSDGRGVANEGHARTRILASQVGRKLALCAGHSVAV
jgi:hypothetical protein